MKLTVSVLAATLLATSTALAQSGPGGVPLGAGTQRGMQGLNNSGQAGFVTLFDHGPTTAMVVALEGSKGRTERVTVQRGKGCDAINPEIAARTTDLRNGISRGVVHISMRRLLSGNYVTVVYSGTAPGSRPVACGLLYQ